MNTHTPDSFLSVRFTWMKIIRLSRVVVVVVVAKLASERKKYFLPETYSGKRHRLLKDPSKCRHLTHPHKRRRSDQTQAVNLSWDAAAAFFDRCGSNSDNKSHFCLPFVFPARHPNCFSIIWRNHDIELDISNGLTPFSHPLIATLHFPNQRNWTLCLSCTHTHPTTCSHEHSHTSTHTLMPTRTHSHAATLSQLPSSKSSVTMPGPMHWIWLT